MYPVFLLFLLFPSSLAIRREKYALLLIKAAITDDPEALLSSWNVSTDECTWLGVTCDKNSYHHRHHRHVTGLSVSGFNLTGNIPADISRLRYLSKLDVSHNSFFGSIPPEISVCKFLTYVDLSSNNLSGVIPNETSTGMRLLNHLNLSRNHLVGGIPASLSTMPFLTSIDFSYNDLSGYVDGNTTGRFNSSSFLGNPNLCGPYLRPCREGTTPPHKKKKGFSRTTLLVVLLDSIAACCVMSLVIVVLITAWRLSKERLAKEAARVGGIQTANDAVGVRMAGPISGQSV